MPSFTIEPWQLLVDSPRFAATFCQLRAELQRWSEDCDALHAGVDEMRKNTNPFTGGINFDAPWSCKK